MLKKILIGVGAVVVLLLVVVAAQPGKYRVVRSLQTSAPPAVVYAQLIDFHRWSAWSPWGKLDPNQKETYGGSPSGVGATYHWAGNDNVGEGTMAITAVKPGERVDIALNFIRPFPSQSSVDFVLQPSGGGTTVTWGMDGTNDLMGKAFGLMVNMDKMLGADFEKGLSALKDVSEAQAKAGQVVAPAAAVAVPMPVPEAAK